MTPPQRSRLADLLPQIREAAHRHPTMNGFRSLMQNYWEIRSFLEGNASERTAEEWIEAAESATRTSTEETKC